MALTPEAVKILAECRQRLDRGMAVATGIGMFAVILKETGECLLRRRLEEDSLYGQDLSGKWEMTGGGAELPHFTLKQGPADLSSYQQSIFNCLAQELMEEAGLKLLRLPKPLSTVPALLRRQYTDAKTGEERISVDFAFSVPIFWESGCLEETNAFAEKLKKGELMFVPSDKLSTIEIVSPRTRFLIEGPLELMYAL